MFSIFQPGSVKRAPAAALVAGLTLALSLPSAALAAKEPSGAVNLEESVMSALQYNPQLKVLQNNRQAIEYEKQRAFGGYFPKVDVTLGYGTESHSDLRTRGDGNDDDFESRGEASVRLTQLLYDGYEVASRVGIESAKLESAETRVFDNAEAIALDAVIAHLEVYRQGELVALAERNVKDHEDILDSLQERQKAGAGSIADVSQTKGRLARAKSSLANAIADKAGAVASYQRVVGNLPGNVVFSTLVEDQLPASLEEALEQARSGNPKVQAFTHDIAEAEQRVRLSNAGLQPKVNLELSSSYKDQVESSTSYEHNNQAMVRLRWNLYNGGSDIADRHAAISRKYQAIASRNDKLVEVVEEAGATWGRYLAEQERVKDFIDAVRYSEETLDAYLKQFNVAQRSLLDVLDARNELFQSSGLLVTSRVNEVIAAGRLLALGGGLTRSLQIEPGVYQKGEFVE